MPQAAATTRSAAAPWTFAVMSDLHIPRDGRITAKLEHVVRAVIASHPRFVVITGDFTDGEPFDPRWRVLEAPHWWEAVDRLLAGFRVAAIPVLPVAGNHDSYLAAYRSDYAAAWRDIDEWAAPLRIVGTRQPPDAYATNAVPFCYGVDVDGVHLTFAHVVDEALERGVDTFIATDLARSQGARLRLVFGHVPLASVAATPRHEYLSTFGRILAKGHADAYISGHEHLVWDEDVVLPGGSTLRQVIVTSMAASWRFAPGAVARTQAHCAYGATRSGDACCTMPHGGGAFSLHEEHGHWYESRAHGFTLITIDGDRIIEQPMAVDDAGAVTPFWQEACP